MKKNADWYVPSLSSANTELPEGLYITMFDSKNHTSELSSEQIKQEYERNAKAVGEYVLSLSPERLALHETIVSISTLLKVQSEDDFVDTFHKIYKEQVLPAIEAKKSLFESSKKIITSNVEKQASTYFSSSTNKDTDYDEFFNKYSDQYSKNITKYKEELEQLKTKTTTERPTREDRAKIKNLTSIIDFMQQNKERIIIDLTINAKVLETNNAIVKRTISGTKGIFDSEYINQFDNLTLHSQEDRKAYLVVGGAASGKGSVTSSVKNSQDDANDLLEINPDLYKKILLPFSKVKGYEELHAAITHVESAMVFDNIAERWQNMALEGKAPNILMDVQRAGNWQLGVLGTGDTSIYASSPVLPTTTALDRAYMRGVKTGRFVPTEEIIKGHKEQLSLNLNAMKKGVSYKFYDTNVNFGDPTPLIAEYSPKNSEMKISDMGAMYDYFSKGELNSSARNLDNLSFATPKSTAKAIIEHGKFMDINIFEQDKQIAKLTQGGSVFEVNDWQSLQQQMGEKEATELLQGIYENKVKISSNDKSIKEVMDKIIAKTNKQEAQENTTSKTVINMQAEEYAQLLTNLVEKGIRVGKTESVYVYDFTKDEEFKDQKITIQTQNLDILSEEAKEGSSNIYDPTKPEKKQMLLVIDPKVYNTQAKRDMLITKMKRDLRFDGTFKAEGVYMNERGKLNDDYIRNENSNSGISTLSPNPEAVRIAYKISDNACRIPVQWDAGGYAIEKDGSVVVRERDLQEIQVALNKYNTDKNPQHLLTEDGKAIFDVYGTDPFFVEDNYSNIYSDVKYKEFARKLLDQGELIETKNATKHNDVIAYQLKGKESVVMPDGTLLTEGSWLSTSPSSIKDIEKSLDLGLSIGSHIQPISKSTMEKSYKNQRAQVTMAQSQRDY